MGRLLGIKTEIGALLSAITTTNGYSFNFGTVNFVDRAKATFPAANIVILSETPSSDAAAYHGFDTCQVRIDLYCQMAAVNTNPLASIDTEYDKVIEAIKDKFHANNGYLPITRSGVLKYTGFRKISSQAGDVFSPDKVEITCEVLYNSNEDTLT
jgi:hypothetical protein